MKRFAIPVVAFFLLGFITLRIFDHSSEVELPENYWSTEEVDTVLMQSAEITLAPDLSGLKPQEVTAIRELMLAGLIFNDIYELSLHPEALEARTELEKLHKDSDGSQRTQDLLDLYYQSKGPITSNENNQRVPFLPVADSQKGRNVYPLDTEKSEIEAYLSKNPEERASIMHLRSVVRKVTPVNLTEDIAKLNGYTHLDILHPSLKAQLERIQNVHPNEGFYGLPYSVHYLNEIQQAFKHINNAADAIENDDKEFARFLRQRGFDLLRDDYEAGDAAWVTGRFNNLNAQIGSYETYDDNLYGVKSFFSLSVLLRNHQASEQLTAGIKNLQAIHDALPFKFSRSINSNLSLGVYDVIADFGQSRGANTATILPNEAEQSRKYGRTIMLRHNILTNPVLFENDQARFAAAVDASQVKELSMDGKFQRTLWHEVGHYLGVDETLSGKDLDASLAEVADHFEEMKADLVSLFIAKYMLDTEQMSSDTFREIQAGAVLRVLNTSKPRRTQAYQTMQLMQFNYFLEHKVFSFDPESQRISIDYELFPEIASEMLKEVLAIQASGKNNEAKAMIEQWGYWDNALHQVLADNMKDASKFRYRRVRYTELENLEHDLSKK